ncbi:hypothetical protein PRZ48_004854 [Zasmidium cellare]|uniref:Uncharacterized protein n=1 Tax=Zasmidium cellare TaxID=395010 RepID=A0ABR0ERE4_ZASCE|nr:hypothetical protein PRZ48_004854 [Zasmidium cellare]
MALLPITLTVISALLSGLYRLSHQLQLTKKQRHTITITHALAIECTQLLILIVGAAVHCLQIAAIDRGEVFTCCGLIISFWLAIPLTLAIYALALFAIDAIDNKIQLGTWRHPIQTQALLLTRSQLLPWTVQRKSQRQKQPHHVYRFTPEAEAIGSSKPVGSPWSTNYLTPELSPTMLSPRTHRSFSEPSTPKWHFHNDMEARRRDSTPAPGSVARLVSTFEIPLRQVDKHITTSVPSTTSDKTAEGISQSSLGLPTPDSSPEKQAGDLSTPTSTTSTKGAESSPASLLVDGLSVASTSFPTPDTTPEKIQQEVPITNKSQEKPSTPNPTTKRCDKQAAQHTAARAQRRRQRQARADIIGI